MQPLSPKISVITVVLNGADYIERAIQSLLQQNYPNLEFIVIDGGSTDHTVDIIKKYSQYIHYWQSQPDGGAGFAMNIGLQHATGDLVAFLFGDDWYEPDTLTKIAAAWQQQPDLDVISCGCKIVFADGISGKLRERMKFEKSKEVALCLENIFFSHSLIGARFFSKKLIDRIGYFVPQENGVYSFCNDHEWLIRIILAAPKTAIVDHMGYVYFAHPSSSTIGRFMPNATAKQYMSNIKRIRKAQLEISERHLQQHTLTKKQRALFNKWHRDQMVRLLICELYTRQWRAAGVLIKKAFAQHSLRIFFTLLGVPVAILKNRFLTWKYRCKLAWSN